jgi:hypothetical protein
MATPAVGVSRIGLCGLAVMGQVRQLAAARATRRRLALLPAATPEKVTDTFFLCACRGARARRTWR